MNAIPQVPRVLSPETFKYRSHPLLPLHGVPLGRAIQNRSIHQLKVQGNKPSATMLPTCLDASDEFHRCHSSQGTLFLPSFILYIKFFCRTTSMQGCQREAHIFHLVLISVLRLVLRASYLSSTVVDNMHFHAHSLGTQRMAHSRCTDQCRDVERVHPIWAVFIQLSPKMNMFHV